MVAGPPPLLSGGLPVLGHAVEMMRHRERLFTRGRAELGDLFAVRLGPRNCVVVTGAEHNRTFYTQTDKSLSMQDGYAFLKVALGEILFTASTADYYNQRPALTEVFRRDRMVGYVRAMNLEVQRWIDALGERGETDLTREMSNLTQRVAAHAMIGPDFEDELGADFLAQYQRISASLDPVLPPHLPLPRFIRRDRARAVIHERLHGAIVRRREHPDRYDDLVTALMTTTLKDGTLLSDEQVVNMFTGLIFAGHETTAGQAAWLITLLLQHPHYLDLVRAEIEASTTVGHELTGAELRELTHLHLAIDETSRMRPSADTQIRTVDTALQIGGHEIPPGWMLMVSAPTSHFLPEVFTDPERFDPLRFSAARGEGRAAFTMVGFGGGIHQCTGMSFAKNEMAVIATLLFQQLELELLSDDVRVVTGAGANHPSEVRVGYRRRS